MTTPDVPDLRAGAILFFGGAFPGISDHARYACAVDTALTAETAGFDDVWVSEHHYIQRSNPSAIALASYLLGRTTRVRVGTAVTLLPTHNPVHVAEQAAVLDHLSGGRFDLGIGRGAQTVEYEVMASLEHWERGMPEALSLLMQSFDGTVEADSSLHRFRAVSPQPRPRTQPHPPVLVASEAEATLALSARHGLPCMFFINQNQTAETVADLVEQHAAIAAERGHTGPWEHTILVHAQVADTDEEAAAVIRGPFHEAIRAKSSEYVWLQESWRQQPNYSAYLENLISHHPIGSPATCIDRLTSLVERSGVRRVILVVECSVAPEAVLENVRRLGRDVLPAARVNCAVGSQSRLLDRVRIAE